jgi:hypothetical protein
MQKHHSPPSIGECSSILLSSSSSPILNQHIQVLSQAFHNKDNQLIALIHSWLELVPSSGNALQLLMHFYVESHEFMHQQIQSIFQSSNKKMKLATCLLFQQLLLNNKVRTILSIDEWIWLMNSLWNIVRNDSILVNDKRQATRLTTCAADCFILVMFSISESNLLMLYNVENYNLIQSFIEELHYWYSHNSKRRLSAEAIEQLLLQLRNLKQYLTTNSEYVQKILGALWNMYSMYLVEDSSLFLPKKKNIHDHITALLIEAEQLQINTRDTTTTDPINDQILFILTACCLLLGKVSGKKRQKLLSTVVTSTASQTVTLQQLLVNVVSYGIRSSNSNIQTLSIYLFRDVLAIGDMMSHNELFNEDNLLSLLDQHDSTSKTVAAFVAEYVINNPTHLSHIFTRIDSSSNRRNALLVLSEIFKLFQNVPKELPQIDHFMKQVADHLLQRLDDDELATRSHAAELFSQLEPEYIMPRIVGLELNRNEKIRSAAHLALTHILIHHTDSSHVFSVLIDAIRYVIYHLLFLYVYLFNY